MEIVDFSSDEIEESFKLNRGLDEDLGDYEIVDRGYLNIEVDLDEMLFFVESDDEDWK